MNGRIQYEFMASIWQYAGQGGWCFVSLPPELSVEIREHFQPMEEGWGRLKVTAKIESSEWKTSIWFDTKINTYLLPLKVEIRKKEKLKVDDVIQIVITI